MFSMAYEDGVRERNFIGPPFFAPSWRRTPGRWSGLDQQDWAADSANDSTSLFPKNRMIARERRKGNKMSHHLIGGPYWMPPEFHI